MKQMKKNDGSLAVFCLEHYNLITEEGLGVSNWVKVDTEVSRKAPVKIMKPRQRTLKVRTDDKVFGKVKNRLFFKLSDKLTLNKFG